MDQRQSPATTRGDMDRIETLCGRLLASPECFPMTYTYHGKTFHGLPADSKKTFRVLDANLRETVYWGRIPDSSVNVRAECVVYCDFPVVEWTVYFTNEGEADSGILEDVWAADLTFPGKGAVLTYCNGDFYSETGYTEKQLALTDGVHFQQAPTDGRPCNGAWPYQRLMFDGFGLNIAIGWPGQWESAYDGLGEAVAFRARQQTVHTLLKPGETLRTPRICVMAFEGDGIRGMNLWRRWMNAHVTVRTNGGIVQPRAAVNEPGNGKEHTACTQTLQFEAMDALKTFGWGKDLVWWIDAGWYPCFVEPGKKVWTHTGTWEPDRSKFPYGMGPIGDRAHALGIDYLIWYEPERVRPGTELSTRHPEWMLSARPADEAKDDDFMLNLADDKCLQWLCRHIDMLVKESHQDVYRQDFNFSPLAYWRFNEAADRRGMLENQYQQNYLKFWDYLLEHNPNLWIDSCASGGRRNDLETMRRSVPLHPTDYGYGYHPICQDFRRTLHAWIPYTRGQNANWLSEDGENYLPVDRLQEVPERRLTSYEVVNSMGTLFPLFRLSSMDAFEGQREYIRKMLGVWREFAPIQLLGDYYPLTKAHRSAEEWTVFQFDCPEQAKGAFQVLRNSKAMSDSITVRPFAFREDIQYTLRNGETGETRQIPGLEICEKGITFSQPRPSGSIWFYFPTA